MQRTSIRLFLLALALLSVSGAVAWADGVDALFASESDDTPLLQHFETGSGDDPQAFQTFGAGWGTTASGYSPVGEPAILTWSIVPDGTALPRAAGEINAPSTLIAFLDSIHGVNTLEASSDLETRPWFSLIESAFERWDQISGLRISYEPNDDGATLGSRPGVLGMRGDHRLGGHPIDGTTSPTIVAYNYFPTNSDMVIDTDEVGRLGNPTSNYLLFRNTLMHEIGHGLGLDHPSSSDQHFLMEPFLDPTIDGPQFDDLLGIQWLYGDRYEENGGNDLPGIATDLGTLSLGNAIAIGRDAADNVISPLDEDFVSINRLGDTDYYRFSLAEAAELNLLLTPLGFTYLEAEEGGTESPFNAAAQNDLSLSVFDITGSTLLASSDSGGLGMSESIRRFLFDAPGDYLVKVQGAQDQVQLYQLDLAVVPEPASGLLLLGAVLLTTLRRSARTPYLPGAILRWW